jgi:hypothetical protein
MGGGRSARGYRTKNGVNVTIVVPSFWTNILRQYVFIDHTSRRVEYEFADHDARMCIMLHVMNQIMLTDMQGVANRLVHPALGALGQPRTKADDARRH